MNNWFVSIFKRCTSILELHCIMSRMSVSTPNKVAVKKVQGQLKTSVSTYGTLILSWRSDVTEIITLIQYYKGLAAKLSSIYNTFQSKPYCLTTIFGYEYIGRRLVALIHLEMESTLMQIKTFEYDNNIHSFAQ